MRIRNEKRFKRERRARRVRKKISGTADRPRFSVFRSAKHIYAQLVNDAGGRTVATASSLKINAGGSGDVSKRIAIAREVGKQLADAAKAHGITKVSFDRRGYQYHGRIAALADAARKNGLEF